MKILPLLFFLLNAGFASVQANSESSSPRLKKIIVTETNNAPYFNRSTNYIHQELNPVYLRKLKSYVSTKDSNLIRDSEVEQIKSVMAWVTKQWAHDGMNQPPGHFSALDILKHVHQKKIQYWCVEYSIVLSEILQSFGFVTRTVALRSKDVAYGGFGQGHVAIEVWINDINKWVFLDPQFGTYLTSNDKNLPLNFYEAYSVKKQNKWSSVDAHFVNPPKDLKAEALTYKNFVSQYFGHMTVSSGPGSPRLSLKLESAETPITFQGMSSNNLIFTDDYRDLYPEMNRATLLLSYKEQGHHFQETMKSLRIETNDDYLAQMSKFAAQPKFSVQVVPNQAFEYRVEKEKPWTKGQGSKIDWDALNPENTLEVRLVNKMGRSGPVTFIKIQYQ